MRRHGRGRHRLKQDPLGVLLVETVQLRAVVEHWEGLDEAEVGHDDDQAGRRLDAVVVRGGKAHPEPGAVLLLVHEALPDRLLDLRVGDHDVVPGLGVGPRWRVASSLEDHLEMLARNLPRREGTVGHPVARDVHQRLVARHVVEIRRRGVGRHGAPS